MKAVFVFDANNVLLFHKCDIEVVTLLLEHFSDLDDASTSPASISSTSTTPEDNVSTSQNDNASISATDGASLDPNFITHLLLPLVMTHRVMKISTNDECQRISSNNVQFALLDYQFTSVLFVCVFEARLSSRKIDAFIHRLRCFSEFCHGSLGESLSHQSFSDQILLLQRLVVATFNESDCSSILAATIAGTPTTSMPTLLVDCTQFFDDAPASKLAEQLTVVLLQELRTFLDISAALLVEDGSIIAVAEQLPGACRSFSSAGFLEMLRCVASLDWLNCSGNKSNQNSVVHVLGFRKLEGIGQQTEFEATDVVIFRLSERVCCICAATAFNAVIVRRLGGLIRKLSVATFGSMTSMIGATLLNNDVCSAFQLLREVLDDPSSGAFHRLQMQWESTFECLQQYVAITTEGYNIPSTSGASSKQSISSHWSTGSNFSHHVTTPTSVACSIAGSGAFSSSSSTRSRASLVDCRLQQFSKSMSIFLINFLKKSQRMSIDHRLALLQRHWLRILALRRVSLLLQQHRQQLMQRHLATSFSNLSTTKSSELETGEVLAYVYVNLDRHILCSVPLSSRDNDQMERWTAVVLNVLNNIDGSNRKLCHLFPKGLDVQLSVQCSAAFYERLRTQRLLHSSSLSSSSSIIGSKIFASSSQKSSSFLTAWFRDWRSCGSCCCFETKLLSDLPEAVMVVCAFSKSLHTTLATQQTESLGLRLQKMIAVSTIGFT